MSDPALSQAEQTERVSQLMDARRAIAAAHRNNDPVAAREARLRVDAAKVALGERGPVWWRDGAPDYNRKMVAGTPYADWYSGIQASAQLQ